MTGGLMALVYAIVDAQSAGWASAKTLGFFALAVVLLAGFVAVELRTRAPLVRLSIFRIRSLLTANIAMFLAVSGMFAMFFFNTLYIQSVLGYGPLKAGLAFLPFTAGVMIAALNVTLALLRHRHVARIEQQAKDVPVPVPALEEAA